MPRRGLTRMVKRREVELSVEVDLELFTLAFACRH
jgi:hypothetical protein